MTTARIDNGGQSIRSTTQDDRSGKERVMFDGGAVEFRHRATSASGNKK